MLLFGKKICLRTRGQDVLGDVDVVDYLFSFRVGLGVGNAEAVRGGQNRQLFSQLKA